MTHIIQSIPQLWRRLAGILAEQPRLRFGVWLIAFILGLNLVWVVVDFRHSRLPEIQRLADQHARLEQVLLAADWAAVSSTARAHLQAAEAQLWRAGSRGLATAEFESFVLQAAAEAGLARLRLEMRPLLELEPDLVRISAQLDADHDSVALIEFLADLAAAEPAVQVIGLNTSSLRPARMRLDVQALFLIGSDRPG